MAAGVVALVAVLAMGPWAIRWLKSTCRERIASDSAALNTLHASKQNTPSMGGLLIVAGVLVGALPFIRLNSPFVWLALCTTAALLGVGGIDDWIKATTDRKGLTVRGKLMAQIVIAVLAATGLYLLRDHTVPQAAQSESLVHQLRESAWIAIPWGALVIVSSCNAVNLTDGLDGLATGCTAITAAAMTILIVRIGNTDTAPHMIRDAAVLCAALCGSSLGFLWFNRHPAQVFMGDAGSLSIGGLLAMTALASRMEQMLLVTGAVFVVETLSVILQVYWYRRTGRRILLCSPLHNHFAFQGFKEPRIVAGFWVVAGICLVIGVLFGQ